MFTQYFGNFLFESKIISREQFQECLQQIPHKRAKLGVLAIEAGYMSPSQVDELHTVQLQVDKKFGELAVEKGYFDAQQLEELLSKQSSPFSMLSQIMCDAGYMTYSQLSEQIERYREKCGMTAERFAQFKNDEMKPLLEKLSFHAVFDEKKRLIVMTYIEIFIKNTLRFISSNVMLGEIETDNSMQGSWISCQKVTGLFDIMTSFTAEEEAMLFFASKFFNKQFAAFDIVARDVLGEFLNCNNGIFIANMIEHGLDLGLEPQTVSDEIKMGHTDDMLSIAFTVEQYSYRLNMAF